MGKRLKKKQIIIVLFSLSLLGLAISFFCYHKTIEDIEIESFKKSVRDSTKTRVEYTKGFINDMVMDLQSTSELIGKYDNIWDEGVQEIIEISNRINLFTFTAVVDKDGNGYSNNGSILNIADEEYFKTAMSGMVSFSEVKPSKKLPGKYIQICAYPLKTKENKIDGVVLGVVDLDTLKNNLENKKSKGNLYIIDSNGNYISRFQKDEFKTKYINFWQDLEELSSVSRNILKIKDDFQNRRKGEFTFCEQGECKYACYMPIGTKNWQLLYTVKDTDVDNKLNKIFKIDITYTLFTSICQLLWIVCIIWYFRKTNKEINKANHEVNKNIEILQIALEHSKQPIFEYNQSSKEMILKTNFPNPLFQGIEKTISPEELVNKNVICTRSKDEFLKMFDDIKDGSFCKSNIQIYYETKLIWLRISLYNIYKEDTIYTTVGFVEDITEIKKIEEHTQYKLELQDALVSKSLLYAKVDLNTEKLLEIDGEETQADYQTFLDEKILKYVNKNERNYVLDALSLYTLKEKGKCGIDVTEKQFMMEFHGEMRWVSCMMYCNVLRRSKLILVINDIDHKKRKEIDLQYRAERDGLTELYNAATTRLKIEEALISGCFSEEKQVLILLDLDNYKQINDTFGHSYGDDVLRDVSNIMKSRFRSSDIIGRIGGDEFIILLRNIRSYQYVEKLIKQLSEEIHRTYSKDDKTVTISASIGVSKVPIDGKTFATLYEKADIALYQVKKKGKNNYRYYEEE